jgi:hypothetical protein
MSDFASRLPARPSFEQLQKQAKEMARHKQVKLSEAQFELARRYGFKTWADLKHHLEVRNAPYRISRQHMDLTGADWDAICDAIEAYGISSVNAAGNMTDAGLARIAKFGGITELRLAGSEQITDEGLKHVARLAGLRVLDLSGWKGQLTDQGLAVLRQLPELRRFQMCWQQHVSDAGFANLAGCEQIESVDLMGTLSGDGAIAALMEKPELRKLKTGRLVTDAGLPLLHHIPHFRTWQGGEPQYRLMEADAGPTHLLLDGPFADTTHLAGLEGLFALSFFWHCSSIHAGALKPLAGLSNLGFLGFGGAMCDDEAMGHIASLPRLRMLQAQGAVAGDDGFAALSQSSTVEYVWGRECPHLTGRGFAALAQMPALRGLAVSCKNVDDAALSALPGFPALREIMPMDVPDDGFRHVGRCAQLEALWCMYCRDTGDLATEHIAGLTQLKSYYAGATQITDRSLEILSSMESLERIEFWQCAGITDEGLKKLARLPNLRQLLNNPLPA